MSVEQILGVIVAAVAVYGAGLSTVTFRAQRRERRAIVKVQTSNGFAVWGQRGNPQLQITATNAGERPVVIEAAGFKLPNGQDTLALINPTTSTMQFPHQLAPHHNCLVAEDMAEIAGSLAQAGHRGRIKLVGFFRDQDGNVFRAKPCDFDIEGWLRQAG